jgi:hypothetical protein
VEGPKNTQINGENDKSNDINEVWDGLLDQKCTKKKLFHIIICLFAQYIYVLWSKNGCVGPFLSYI